MYGQKQRRSRGYEQTPSQDAKRRRWTLVLIIVAFGILAAALVFGLSGCCRHISPIDQLNTF